MSTKYTFQPASGSPQNTNQSYESQGLASYATGGGNTIDPDLIWRSSKFTRSLSDATHNAVGSFNIYPGGTGAGSIKYHTLGAFFQYTNVGTIMAVKTSSVFLRFDTSSLDASMEITGAKLSIYPQALLNTASASSPGLIVLGGITGGNDRPTFAGGSPASGVGLTDRNWYCESAGGCSSASCNANEGASEIGSISHADMSTGSMNDIILSQGTKASDGSSTSFDSWINRSGTTYIWISHNVIYDTSSSTVCSYGSDTCPITFPARTANWGIGTTCSIIASGGTTANHITLEVSMAHRDKKFQMII